MSDGSRLASQQPQARALHGTTAQGRAPLLERRWNVGKPGRRGLRSIFRPSHPGLIWACSHAKPCIKQLSPPHLRSRNVEARWNVEARQPLAARSIGTPASRSSLTLRPTIKVRCCLRTCVPISHVSTRSQASVRFVSITSHVCHIDCSTGADATTFRLSNKG